jgi:hypothetical protein
MDVRSNALVAPGGVAEVHYFLRSTTTFYGHGGNREDCFAAKVALSKLRHFLSVLKGVH